MASPTPFIPLAPDTFSGRKLGKYEIVCRLSTGGMSEIFLAFQRGVGGFHKYVVLKQILPDIKGEEEFVRMFLDEAKITAAFNHPSIAQVFDLDIADGELFLAMEFVPGATLVEVARMCRINGEPIPIGLTLQSVRDTALALHYAHTFTDPLGQPQPVIHRDIAEKNVMVTYEGSTKLLDFGIAKSQANSGRTMVGMVKGTSGYMSPEQIMGERLDGRSDIFSLGVVLHECLTGMRLFHAKTPEQGLLAPLRETVNPPSKQNPAISPEIDEVVLKALKRSRDERQGTALELARDLEAAAGKLIWNPEQTAPFIQRIFADRREQTRQLLTNAQHAATSELTGEIRLNAFLRGDAPPQPLTRNPPTPRPSSPPPAAESTDPGRVIPLSSGRKLTNPGLIAPPKPPRRTTTDEVTNPRTPPRGGRARSDNEHTQPLGSRSPPPADEVTQGTKSPEPKTKLNRPEALLKLMETPVKHRNTGGRAAIPPTEQPEGKAEARTTDNQRAASRPPVWDRDDDDDDEDEDEDDDNEVRTQVQPPLTTRSPTRSNPSGEHDTVSAVAPPGSDARKYVLIGLVSGAVAIATMVGVKVLMGGVVTSAEMTAVADPSVQLPPEPIPLPNPNAAPEKQLAIVPVEAANDGDAGALAKTEAPTVDTPQPEKAAAVQPVEKVVEKPAVKLEEKQPDDVVKQKKSADAAAVPADKKSADMAPVDPPPEKRSPPKKLVTPKQTVEKVVAAADPKATGQLTLVTTPYAKVFFKSQDLGVTPLFKIPLPVGRHTLKLIGPDNQVVMLPVEIHEGVVTTLRQKLADVEQ